MKTIHLIFAFFLGIFPATLLAQDSICAAVRIEIQQELTFERQGFEAIMRINNGYDDLLIEDVDIDVYFEDADGNPVLATSDPNDLSASFFIRTDSMENISDIAGSGVVPAASTSTITWLIVPALNAGGQVPSGTRYNVGATLSYSLNGETTTFDVIPDTIFVKPMPELTLDYFMPEDVYGDNPFTQEVEPAVPFTLGVRVKNTGYGDARNVQIDSGQPTIVDDEQGLLVGFQITGSQVNGQPADDDLKVSFGDIAANTSATARWFMEATLNGRFTDFGASYSHANELGGQLTSLLGEVDTHTLIHEVLVDQPGRDTYLDFLADDNGTTRVYETDGVDTDVANLSANSHIGGGNNRFVIGHPTASGFIYIKLQDPMAGLAEIASVTRADGKVILSENVWLHKTWDKIGVRWHHWISLFDESPLDNGYIVNYRSPESQGNQSPVLAYMSDKELAIGQTVGFLVRATDPNGSTPFLRTGSLPFGASFIDRGDGTGIFGWTPQTGQTGVYPFTFIASDGELETTATVNITVSSTGSNLAPVAEDNTITPFEDTTFRGFLSADDPNGDILTFSIATPPTNGTVEILDTATGEYRYTPNADYDGTDSFVFSAADSELSANGTITIALRPSNDQPILSNPIADQSTESGVAWNFVIPANTFLDPDGDTLAVSVASTPVWLSFDSGTLTFSGTPASGDVGTITLDLTATDVGGLVATDSFDLTISLGANGEISGLVFNDLDRDGNQDVGEAGYDALSVYLDTNRNGVADNGEPVTTTDSNGNFSFTTLLDDTYLVRVAQPANTTARLAVTDQFSANALTGGNGQTRAISVDLDGDGLAELISTHLSDNQIQVQSQTTVGSFAAAATHAVGTAPVALAAADIDGDGDADIIVANRDSANLSILTNSGDTLQSATSTGSFNQPVALAVADINGDGHQDIAVADAGTNTIEVLTGDGTGTFTSAISIATAGTPGQLVQGNFDGTGGADLAVTHPNGLNVFTQISASSLSTSNRPMNTAPTALVTIDLDGDAVLDLVAAATGTTALSAFTGNGDGSFTNAEDIQASVTASYMASADANADGFADLLLVDGSANQTVWLQGTGYGQFRSAEILASSFAPDFVLASDLDGDGDADLTTTASGQLTTHFNRATPLVHLSGGATLNLDLPLVATPGMIEGLVFDDINSDTIQGPGEDGLADWSLYLDLDANGQLDAGEPVRYTDSNGLYRFTDVAPGDHQLVISAQVGWSVGAPAGGAYTTTVTSGSTTVDQDFALRQVSLGDLVVDTFTDAVDANPGDGLPHDNAGNTTLRAAIMEANALPGEDTVVLAAGTYTLSLAGTLEDAAATGDLDITDDLIISAPGAHLTTIDAAQLDRIFHVDSGVTLTLSGVTLSGGDTGATGTTLELSGGALLNEGTTTLSAVALTDNLAEESGGAVHTTGILTLTDSAVYTNNANNGAGVSVANGATATLTNVTLSGNTALNGGGAIDNVGTLDLVQVTASTNTATDGGGVRNSGTATLGNTLVAANNAGVDPDLGGAFSSNGGNLIGDIGDATGITHGANGDQAGDDLNPIDPMLMPLALNGGTSVNHALEDSSPAIDAGVPALGAETDQRGYARPIDGDLDGTSAYDVGAVEASPALFVATPNGGEVIKMGAYLPVTWTSSAYDGLVNIELSRDGGNTWEHMIGPKQNDGYSNLQFTGTPSDQCLIRVISSTDPTVYDVSDAFFTIDTPVVSLNSHHGGVTLTPGTTEKIYYDYSGLAGYVKIELSRNGGTDWETIVPSIGAGPYTNWSVTGPGTTDAVFRVSSTVLPEINAVSAAPNTILDPVLEFTSHNGGVDMTLATIETIGFNRDNFTGGLTFEVSYDDGSTWNLIHGELGYGPTTNWVVEGTPSTTVRFRLTSNNIPSLSVTSAANTILTPSITFTSHNGGEVMEPGEAVSIGFDRQNFAGAVTLEVTYDDGATWNLINNNLGYGPSTSWQVQPYGSTQVRFRMSSNNVPGVSDESDAVNTILTPTLSLTTHDGGQVMNAGEITIITFDRTNWRGSMTMEVSFDNGSTWSVIDNNLGNGPNKNWVVPNQPSTEVLFRLTSNIFPSITYTSAGTNTIQ